MSFRSCLTALSLLMIASCAVSIAPAQTETPELAKQVWPAHWVGPSNTSWQTYGVYHFRRTFDVSAKPSRFVIHVSADNRYRLLLNGVELGRGPQRGDLTHWRYDTYDLAPGLLAGRNVLAAEVVNFGTDRAAAYISYQTGLLVQGEGPAEQVLNTGPTWKVASSGSYAALPPDRARLQTYIVSGPGDRIDGSRYPWGWESLAFDDSGWMPASSGSAGMPYGVGTDVERWLVPRSLPLMESSPQRLGATRRVSGISLPDGFPVKPGPLTVPAGTEAVLLIDQGFETIAYPRLTLSGGAGSSVTLSYAEALFDAQRNKGHRDQIDGRELLGVSDQFLPDGGTNRLFTTTDFRCYRYVELRVKTGATPLVIEDLSALHTGYPFQEKASFASADPVLGKIWEVGWRTARNCAFETYMDCPYYERLQYTGDTRIQALLSLYVSGDDRLMRTAIDVYDQSRVSEGLTQSRYPSASLQIINTFSLFWTEMVSDYWMHRSDEPFVRSHLNGVEAVLRWFEERIDPKTGLLGPLPYWGFVDWTKEWPWDQTIGSGGEAPGAHTGGSAIITLQLIVSLDRASDLMKGCGRMDRANHYRLLADQLRRAVKNRCWDSKRLLFSDVPGGTTFSQHANALAVLARVLPASENGPLVLRTLEAKDLAQCSLYFRFYLLRALKQVGLGDRYLSELGAWKQMLDLGLTTFAETPDAPRSDCHAWSASPVYEFLATVCGVEPASPGFASVRIEPHLGALKWVQGSVPHPKGMIEVRFDTREGNRATVTLPEGLQGQLLWKGHEVVLKPGKNDFTF